jgi:hypothetical protein
MMETKEGREKARKWNKGARKERTKERKPFCAPNYVESTICNWHETVQPMAMPDSVVVLSVVECSNRPLGCRIAEHPTRSRGVSEAYPTNLLGERRRGNGSCRLHLQPVLCCVAVVQYRIVLDCFPTWNSIQISMHTAERYDCSWSMSTTLQETKTTCCCERVATVRKHSDQVLQQVFMSMWRITSFKFSPTLFRVWLNSYIIRQGSWVLLLHVSSPHVTEERRNLSSVYQ